MAKAINTYGVNIEASTGALDLQGDWRKLPGDTLYKLRELLRQRWETAPLERTSNGARPPTDNPQGPTWNKLLYMPTVNMADNGKADRRTRDGHTIDLTGDTAKLTSTAAKQTAENTIDMTVEYTTTQQATHNEDSRRNTKKGRSNIKKVTTGKDRT